MLTVYSKSGAQDPESTCCAEHTHSAFALEKSIEIPDNQNAIGIQRAAALNYLTLTPRGALYLL